MAIKEVYMTPTQRRKRKKFKKDLSRLRLISEGGGEKMLRKDLTANFKKKTRVVYVPDGMKGTVISKNNHEIYVEWDDGFKQWYHRKFKIMENIIPMSNQVREL